MESRITGSSSADRPLLNPFDYLPFYNDSDWGTQKFNQTGWASDDGENANDEDVEEVPVSHHPDHIVSKAATKDSGVIVIDDSSEESDEGSDGDDAALSSTVINADPISSSQLSPPPAPSVDGGESSSRPAASLQRKITSHFSRNAMAMLMASAKRESGDRGAYAPRVKSASSSSSRGAHTATGAGKGTKAGRKSSWGALPSSGGGGGGSYDRQCPFYKRIPGSSFIVDGFQYASPKLSKHYFLSHFHSDHYTGLTRHFDFGVIYCTSVTASLLQLRMGISPKYIRSLPMNTPILIDGVQVTLMDANHCPGAVMILFEMSSGKAYLHVGDFRWSSSMKLLDPLRGYCGASLRRLDALFLDTTYCNPEYTFPPQEACVKAAVQTALHYARDPGIVLMFGSYTIGKERVFMEVARALKERVYVDRTKFKTLCCLEWDLAETTLLTCDPQQARIHVVPMSCLTLARLHDRLRVLQRGMAATATSAHTSNPPAAKRPALTALGSNALAAATPVRKPAAGVTKRLTSNRGSLFASLLSQTQAATAVSSAPSTDAFSAMMESAAASRVAAAGDRESSSGSSARPREPYHSVVAFRPTGWAHSSRSASGVGPHDDGDIGIPGDTASFVDVATQGAHGWSRSADAEDSALPGLSKAVPRRAEGVGDVHEQRTRGTVGASVYLDADSGVGLGIDSGGVNAGPGALLGHLHTVRMSKSTRGGGAVVRPAFQGGRDASLTPTTAPPTAATTSSSSSGIGATTLLGGVSGTKRGSDGAPLPSCGTAARSAALRAGVTLFAIPYSEHSSFSELQDCVEWLDPVSVIPTVNCRSAADAKGIVDMLRAKD